MNKRQFYFYSFLIITIAVVALLVSGSSLLLLSLSSEQNIPLGTFITWVGMIALPITIFWGIKELRQPKSKFSTLLSKLIKVMIILGVLWVPISFLLAGNISFTFTEKATFQGGQAAMRWFWRLSYGIGIGSVSILVLYWVTLMFKK